MIILGFLKFITIAYNYKTKLKINVFVSVFIFISGVLYMQL